MPYPYTLEIAVYNSAGEIVKFITTTLISGEPKDVLVMTGGKETTIFNPKEDGLTIKLPGIQSPGQEGGDFTSEFMWDGMNTAGATVLPGSYFIKLSVKDQYNHVMTRVKDIQVLYIDKYLRLSIYNSAGELVQRINADSVPDAITELTVNDIAAVGKSSQTVEIQYAAGQVIKWDGKNSDGRFVQTGMYEIMLELDSGNGFKTTASKSVTVFNDESNKFISGIKIFPNPVTVNKSFTKPVNISWNPGVPGKMTIEVYNMASELVSRVNADLAGGTAQWNIDTFTGKECTGGIYMMLLHAQTSFGGTQNAMAKFAVIRK